MLFDLDGTLVDTAPDLLRAVNRLRADRDEPALSLAALRPHVSHGAGAMIEHGLGVGRDDPAFDALRLQLLDLYRADITSESTLFEGMPELLETLERRGTGWGVVTNKPGRLTDPLLVALGLHTRACCAISGDTLPRAKPHPDPILAACARAGCAPHTSLYVGDAERDIEAGRRAGARTLVARFGYIGPDDRPETWGADGIIDHPHEVLAWV
ncbi:MAG: HAD-IA family hydrolase [Chromatiales bacterium]|nr:HAD-IA family hydrolase [Chromatiales bacterium]